MLIDERQALKNRYWYAIQDEDQIDWLTEDQVANFDQVFEQATLRTMQLGPTGIFLSGGLDSVSIAALAADIAQKNGYDSPLALSLIFPFPEINEKDIQQGVANDLGLSQILIDLCQPGEENQLLEDAIEYNSRLYTIPLNLWLSGYQKLTQAAVDSGRTIILTGSGGDEWLNVSPTYAADLIRQFRFGELNQLLYQYMHSFDAPTSRLIYNGLWKFGVRPLLGKAAGDLLLSVAPGYIHNRRRASYLRNRPAWIAPDPKLSSELTRRVEETVAKSIQEQHIKSLYIREMHTGLEHPLVAMELETSYELAQNYNITKLAPFQDADLVDFLYRTPPRFLIKGGMAKGLVRESLRKRFPNLGFESQKKRAATGFFRHVLINQGRISWEKHRHAEVLASLGIIDQARLDTEMQAIFTGTLPPINTWLIWNVLSLEAWTKKRTL